MLRNRIFAIAAAGAVSIGLLSALPGVASAVNATFPNSGYGFDGQPNIIVGGGSVTVYKLAQSLATLWGDTQPCIGNLSINNQPAPPVPYPPTAAALGQCTNLPQTYAGSLAGGNFDGDTAAIATPTGSSAGIGALNQANGSTAATIAYEGVNATIPTSGDPNAQNGLSNGFGAPDFALSSRAAKTSGGNCAATAGPGDELKCDTFWGVASDGVAVLTFDSASGVFANAPGGTTNVGLSAQDLFYVFNCQITKWGQLPEWQAANTAGFVGLPDAAAPIVPWSMNKNSGTFGDFNSWIAANATGVPSGWTVNAGGCDRELTGTGGTTLNAFPIENDAKPLVTDAQTNEYDSALYTWPTTSATGTPCDGDPYTAGQTFPAGVTTSVLDSPQNPNNWLWFGSFGLFNQYPYLGGGTLNVAGTNVVYSTGFNAISNTTNSPGTAPNPTNIGNGTYPIGRILSIVTKKADADCQLNTSGVCDFTQTVNPGPNNGNGAADISVTGATSGKGGAVREFVRFLCRPAGTGNNLTPVDIYTGKVMSGTTGEITTVAIKGTGFQTVPTSKRSPGSGCDVISNG